MKTILITGGAGFIGSNFVRYLYEKYPDYRIMVVDLLTYAGSVQNFPTGSFEDERYDFWYGDVRNGELMDTLVSQADIVVHMAAESHVTRSIYDNRLFFETDVIGTQTVANSVVKYLDRVERFVHISTSEVYGNADSELMDEVHPLNPMSPYAAAKCGADRLVYSYWSTYKIPAVIIRPFNNFGPNQHLEKLIPRLITSSILNEPLTIHGDGTAARDWLFVEDHCAALDRVLHVDLGDLVGQTFNLGTGEHKSILEVAHTVQRLMEKEETQLFVGALKGSSRHPAKLDSVHSQRSQIESESANQIQYVGDRPGQVFRHTCDASKALKILGWEPLTSFEDGLTQTINWYRDNEDWWRRQMWMRHIPIVTASGRKEMH